MNLQEFLFEVENQYQFNPSEYDDRRRKSLRNISTDESRILGNLYIEFARIKKRGSIRIPIVIKADGSLSEMLNMKDEVKFENYGKLESFLERKFGGMYGGYKALPNKIKEYYIDIKKINKMISDIKYYANEIENKSKSLARNPETAKKGEKNPAWDLRVVFKKNTLEKKIQPEVQASSNKMGVIVTPKEVEKRDRKI